MKILFLVALRTKLMPTKFFCCSLNESLSVPWLTNDRAFVWLNSLHIRCLIYQWIHPLINPFKWLVFIFPDFLLRSKSIVTFKIYLWGWLFSFLMLWLDSFPFFCRLWRLWLCFTVLFFLSCILIFFTIILLCCWCTTFYRFYRGFWRFILFFHERFRLLVWWRIN